MPPATVSENPRGKNSTPEFRTTAGGDSDAVPAAAALAVVEGGCLRNVASPASVSEPERPTFPSRNGNQQSDRPR